MSYWRSYRRSRYDDYYPRQMTAAEKAHKATLQSKALERKGLKLEPIVLEGRTIAKTFWGKAWCQNVESYQDYSNRLPRGRSYVRAGSVIDLKITPGHVSALVAGSDSEPYSISIDIKPITDVRWEQIREKCVGKVESMMLLLKGELPQEVLESFCNQETGLFPKESEITMSCSCPDWSHLCKHLAAVLYGIGAKLDTNPKLFFTLRGIPDDKVAALISMNTLIGTETHDAPEIGDLSGTFGVDFDELDDIAEQTKTTNVKIPSESKTLPQPKSQPTSTVKKEIETKASAGARTQATQPVADLEWTAERVKQFRLELKLTQKEFAARCGDVRSPVYVSQWENGKPISERYLQMLTNLYSKIHGTAGENLAEAGRSKQLKPEAGGTTGAKPVVASPAPVEGDNLVKSVMQKRQMTRSELAIKLGITYARLYNWDMKKSGIPEEFKKKLRRLLK